MKKLLSITLALVAGLALALPSNATVTLSKTAGLSSGDALLLPAAVTVTANDTTATISGPVLDNRDGRIEFINVGLNVTASSGTTPTANIILKGSTDGTNFYTVQSADATPVAVQSGATSTSSATVIGLDTAQELRSGGLPPFLRVDVVQGGTTPGLTAVESIFILRKHVQK